jgi:hypothetical protein
MLGSFCKPIGLPRRSLVHRRARLGLTNDGRGAFALESFRRGEPVAGGRRRRGADLHGGARHHHRAGRAALYRRRSVGDSRTLNRVEIPQRYSLLPYRAMLWFLV